ncbi:MAG: nucleotidyltransferase family protein [Spirulinaceae cyanobacterium]
MKASPAQIAAFCHRWQITEFALFGSVLRDDFGPNSDIDVLLTFAPEQWLTWDDWQRMQIEVETLI